MNQNQIDAIKRAPLIAILRGITPPQIVDVVNALAQAGFYFIEVTADSPGWQDSIQKITRAHGDDLLIGAGTVLTVQDVDRLYAAGGQAVISPNVDEQVIRHSKARGMISVPGCFTPSECFSALQYGADILKIFPANPLGITHLKSIGAVLPNNARLCPTGGIDADNIADYLAIGIFAAGIGAALYRPGIGLEEITASAHQLITATKPAKLTT